MESARRASEIHKRRTGRSLRVTEQDVVNEEMYEEEDDDLPMQYRRLTAHLQTGSADFNRRLSAYLTNHVAMRSALDQAITNSYAQQYPNAPQFAHNHQSMYPSPFMGQNMPQQQSPQSYVQPPYNLATGTPSYRPLHHFRSASIPGPHETPGYGQNVHSSSPVQGPNHPDQRRMSMPAKSVSPPGSAHTPIFPSSRPTLQQASSSYSGNHPTSPHYATKQDSQSPGQMQAPPQPQSLPQQSPPIVLGGFQEFGPLTTSLPPESQQLLGGSLDPNDALTSVLMAGSEYMMPSYNGIPATSKGAYHSSYDGMSATLAPSALDISPRNVTNPPPITSVSNLDTSFQLCVDGAGPDFPKGQLFSRSNSSPGSGSGTGTPVEVGWDAFLNDNPWENVM